MHIPPWLWFRSLSTFDPANVIGMIGGNPGSQLQGQPGLASPSLSGEQCNGTGWQP